MDTEGDLPVIKHGQDQSAAEFDAAACWGHAHIFYCRYLLTAAALGSAERYSDWLLGCSNVIGWNWPMDDGVILCGMWFYIKSV